jgi:phosphoglycolate phosphatase
VRTFLVRAVALDLDGTLLDTLPDIAEAANRMLDDLGRPRADLATVRSYIGDGIPRLTKRLLSGQRDGEPDPALFARALPLFERHYRDTFTLTTRPFPGVLEGLERMRAASRLACAPTRRLQRSSAGGHRGAGTWSW